MNFLKPLSPFFSMLTTKRLIIGIVLALCVLSAHAQQYKRHQNYVDYIEQYKDLAIEQMLNHKIPASITLAQGLLESAAGASDLARKGNNHFGIKCNGWTGKTMNHDDDLNGECFRVYNSVRESYEDHSKFLERDRYKKLFQLSITDYEGWARGLKECGYATNPKYAQNLIGIIQTYELYQYDKAKSYDHFMAQHANDQAANQEDLLHPIYRFNKNYYLRARKGDTYDIIAKEVGISARKLAKYNEQPRKTKLVEGEVVYLKKKQKKAPKEYKKQPHVVKAGDSMYAIAQMYGIRLKSLYKMNKLSPDHTLRKGEKLKLR